MTPPTKELARDIASELDRRRRHRRFGLLLVVAAAVVAALMYLRCSRGLGKGKGKGASAPAVTTDAGPARCTLRVTSGGIAVDGKPMTRDEAVTACRKTDGAMVTVTGDARQGDWDELRAALQAVGVKIYVRGELWDGKDPPTSPSIDPALPPLPSP
jgi:hypothetical protein